LQGQLGGLDRAVFQDGLTGQPLTDPGLILVRVGRVDDQQPALLRQTVEQQVVNDAARLCAHRGIDSLAVTGPAEIVGDQALQIGQRIRAAEPQFAHVRHVEQAGARPDRLVFFENALVLDRQSPAAKVDNLAS